MTCTKPLFLYEEIMLLALRNQQGTAMTSYLEYAIASAVLAELLLNHRITVEDTRKKLVTLHNTNPTGDSIIDECMTIMKTNKRRESLKTWVSRLAGIKKLQHNVARQLCNRGILCADENRVLHIFTRKIYPEINPIPKEKIVERLSAAIFTNNKQCDPRTVVLISLANSADLLSKIFGRKEVGNCKKRIERIVNGEMTGRATKELIAACETAVMIAVIMPTIMASTSD